MAFEVGPQRGDKRLILGIEVFRAGEQTDSAGRTRNWSADDLVSMVDAFNAGVPGNVRVKLGHSSDGFNKKVAEALAVPIEVLTGESPEGDGAASLGEVAKLSRKADILEADFAVMEGLVPLIQQGMFSEVSSEILTDYDGYDAVLSGVALLGAERPAVKDLSGLSASKAASVMSKEGQESLVYAFSLDGVGESQAFGKEANVDDFAQQVMRKLGARFHAQSPEEALSLIEEIVEALGQLIKVIAGGEGDILPEEIEAKLTEHLESQKKSSFREGRKSGSRDAEALFREEIAKRDERITELERQGKIAQYREVVRPLLIEGTPDELAERLAEIETKAGEDVANELLAAWRRESDAMLKFTTSIGTSRPGDMSAAGSDFEVEVARFRESNPGSTQAKAYESIMRSHPHLYRAYAESRKAFSANSANDK